ncbi:ferredoxin--NADP reductase [Subsaximicrobium wynnwilliamsii]|jgi:ring-1,2-phenylacetyl-CoA epoxidase subunit PaaE|uniref:Ferredoxin--NADP reductase n=1 Tax=Subsaximicrobium wynnwilliamsii TaxID=291179 RepID=A0A5C6ZHS2_9FLAO|nr:ferredoxin--NADP reductase [Subsaximicrobium wynnwilliamsii]TXD83938.1 ferredoxin--NADP reductase [Subsaximicrobium wynnwilliamsii]TXD89678.1 ferredoxin--NADP reductase [Subsaximicrobium wynnwilliamsii]TXE01663.1 ferredoxin--NADP reductase [Subsaximicrobium wynnwilliamsii]
MSHFHKLSIAKVTRETSNAVTLNFDVPAHLKADYAYKAGQYITLKTHINGIEVRRDYSLCSSPKSGLLQVAVKEVAEGIFSAHANTHLQVGDELEVAPPKGRFVFEPNDNKTKNIALFAAGSGITPILSIIKCALEEEVLSKVILVYGNKTTEDTMFLKSLLALQKQYHERFSIQFVFSQADEDNAIFGRIEKSTVNYVMKNKHKHIDVDAYYLCGPEGMIFAVKDVLLANDVDENRVHFELFKAAKPIETNDTGITDGKTKVKVMLDDETFDFEMSQNQTILEAALDEDLDAPYSCQGGICSSCIARITEGEATMRQNNILTDAELKEGLILTCQAQPTTETITVDYDDV